MYPILFRIPLSWIKFPLKLWWALAAVAGIAVIYGLLGLRRGERRTAVGGVIVAAALGGAAWKWKEVSWQPSNIPIYSYGVMLGLSLVIGWYLTLRLAAKEGLPKETMANCYVITALAAIAGSRLLYVVTNIPEFEEENATTHVKEFVWTNIFALRKGGLVAYGGFVGGFLGSWGYLASKKIRLLPWADAAVPSLASGLLVTRIGCYLFGCDFGTRLSDGAPGWLKKLGTFPHWADKTLEHGDGSPAWVRHMELFRGGPLEQTLRDSNHSLPVHPTQLYESLVGLALLGLLFWQRKSLRFRGQLFFLFVFAYGVLRFLLEVIRDDTERGSWGPTFDQHVFIPLCLGLMALGFVFGISLGIKNVRARTFARVFSFVPAIASYFVLRPGSYLKSTPVQLSTSQWIALLTALLVSYFYASYWQLARRNPQLAMSLGEIEEEEQAKAKSKKKGKKKEEEEAAAKEEPAEEEAGAEGDDDDEAEAPEEREGEGEGDAKDDEKPAKGEKKKGTTKGEPSPA